MNSLKWLASETIFADILIFYCQVESLNSFPFVCLPSVSCFIRLEKNSVMVNKNNESRNLCLVFNLRDKESNFSTLNEMFA